jgi:hypothetical protein
MSGSVNDSDSRSTIIDRKIINHDSGTTFKDGDIYVSSTNVAYYYSPTVTSSEINEIKNDISDC